MRVYVTKNTEYPVFDANGIEAIMAVKGENKDRLYGILGFYDDNTPIVITQGSITLNFYSKKEGGLERITPEDLPKLLDKTAERGKSIVSRLLTERGEFAPIETPWVMMVTSPIQEIRE
ncbi:MAG TPA: hypothetical protein VMC07_01485 [Candidatus Omnitrophota bacterium]|nr:hypothetical protein [Candidatus Omnitrophota bacterium]